MAQLATHDSSNLNSNAMAGIGSRPGGAGVDVEQLADEALSNKALSIDEQLAKLVGDDPTATVSAQAPPPVDVVKQLEAELRTEEALRLKQAMKQTTPDRGETRAQTDRKSEEQRKVQRRAEVVNEIKAIQNSLKQKSSSMQLRQEKKKKKDKNNDDGDEDWSSSKKKKHRKSR